MRTRGGGTSTVAVRPRLAFRRAGWPIRAMSPEEMQAVAAQLRRPSGAHAAEVAEMMAKGNAAVVQRVAASMPIEAGHHILEIGPGGGELAMKLTSALGPSGRYLAFEYSPDMVELVRRRLSTPARVEVVGGDFLNPEVGSAAEAGRFDHFVAVNVAYFVDDLDAFFGRARACLRPGGRLVLGQRTEPCLADIPFTEYGFHRRSLDVYLRALGRNGFERVTADFAFEGSFDAGGRSFPIDSVVITAS